MTQDGWVDDVLGFWFGELTHEDRFGGKPETDDAIRTRFGALYERLKADMPARTGEDPRTALATVIVYDQFPRNLFRRQALAFGTDDMALLVARTALDRSLDAGMTAEEKSFLYMPFMHSEVMSDQERCIDLFKSLGNEEGVKYAIEHRDIIERFGRFPHRNRALGRESTPDEIAFLVGHHGYGQ